MSVGFILTRKFTLCAFANFVDVLRLAADEGDRSRQIRCSWRVLSPDMEAIASSANVTVRPDERLGDPTKFDYIVVVGGLINQDERMHPEYVSYLQKAAALGVPLIGVCTGAFVLHAAGLMNGYRCCISWFHHEDFVERFEGMRPVADQIFVVDRDRYTCSGGVSSAHLAAYLVDRHLGEKLARKSLKIMIIDEAEKGEKSQPGPQIELRSKDPIVNKALVVMQQNLDTPLRIEALAERLKLGRRQLERRFRISLGLSPTDVYLTIRLSHAEDMLNSSSRSIASIAAESGFCDSSHFTRAFRERYQQTPVEFRKGAVPKAA